MLLFVGAIAVVLLLILLDLPIAFSFGTVAFVFAYLTERDLDFLLPYAFWQAGGFALLALPLFILTGSLMIPSGISDRMVNLINAYVGHIKGALGVVTIIACALFGAMSGSASSAIAAVGSVVIPRMEAEGYPRGYVSSLVAVSSVLTDSSAAEHSHDSLRAGGPAPRDRVLLVDGGRCRDSDGGVQRSELPSSSQVRHPHGAGRNLP